MRARSLLWLAATAAFFVAAVPASADIGWVAKWKGHGEVTVTVSGISAFPAEDQALIRAAMADWSASPNVEYVEVASGGDVQMMVSSSVCPYACAAPDLRRTTLLAVAIYINPVVLTWADRQASYCHELGHGLGLGEGYPVEQTGDYGSCMAGSEAPAGGLHPSQMDFDVLAAMYGGKGARR